MRRSFWWGIVVLVALFLSALFWYQWTKIPLDHEPSVEGEMPKGTSPVLEASDPILSRESQETVLPPESSLIQGVPFTVQAPFAEWNNPIFQDACEEASLIMARSWVLGQSLSRDLAKKEILALTDLEKKKFGQAVDTSITDTAWLLTGQYGITTAAVKSGITTTDMRAALADRRIVIVPTDGRKLHNPNFKRPGPTRHMVVVVGYSAATKEFIVNDPGTRKGEGFRYPESVLFDAILDYPTGDHVPATSTDKVMLVVWKG